MANAESLPSPQGKTILTISGNIQNTNSQDRAEFDRDMLEALKQVVVATKTPWDDGVVTFEGVAMDELMQLVGADGMNVQAIALNDYTTQIPMSDFSKHKVILAIKKNGEYMPVRDKGPLFIIYPYDSKAELQSQVYYGRSAWQLSTIVVE
uniref:molybdopterin-dependent oxidoreductase n=1 Tax=Pararhizobium sp. IMCC3301 TaxID=3067904 RepID=UPI0027404D41|nr:molybdopterin-dependent oxidoreductase [Pararhizobium sp. IMCC3301]